MSHLSTKTQLVQQLWRDHAVDEFAQVQEIVSFCQASDKAMLQNPIDAAWGNGLEPGFARLERRSEELGGRVGRIEARLDVARA